MNTNLLITSDDADTQLKLFEYSIFGICEYVVRQLRERRPIGLPCNAYVRHANGVSTLDGNALFQAQHIEDDRPWDTIHPDNMRCQIGRSRVVISYDHVIESTRDYIELPMFAHQLTNGVGQVLMGIKEVLDTLSDEQLRAQQPITGQTEDGVIIMVSFLSGWMLFDVAVDADEVEDLHGF